MSIHFFTPYLATDYQKFRVTYPDSILHPAWQFLSQKAAQPLVLLDLGCGTGEVLISSVLPLKALGAGLKWIMVDRDSEMLKEAASRSQGIALQLGIQKLEICAFSHNLPLESSSVDFVFIASAFHWMKLKETAQELQRILRPGGAVFICEYQFPKKMGEQGLEFNEKVRKLFNTEFRAPGQTPRGKLKELIRIAFGEFPGVQISEYAEVPWVEDFNIHLFLGMLFTQSRAIHAFSSLNEVQLKEKKQSIELEFSRYFNGVEAAPFFFKNKSFMIRWEA